MKKIFFTIFVTSFLFLSVTAAYAQITVQITEENAVSQTIPVKKGQEASDTEVRAAALKLVFSNGRTSKIEALSLYNAETQRLWWRWYFGQNPLGRPNTIDKFLQETSLYVANDKLLCFGLEGDQPALVVKEAQPQYNTSAAAYAAMLTALKQDIEQKQQAYLDQGFQTVDLWTHLGESFFYPAGVPYRKTIIAEVVQDGTKWKILLQAPDNKRAVVELDGQYKVLNVVKE